MKKFDHEGLLLAEYQGKLFERSYEQDYSTGIFYRRFLHSNLLKELDKNSTSSMSLDVDEGIRDINNQFGKSEYGKEKTPADTLFWIGYMYRYIAYTRDNDTRFVTKLFDFNQMREVYYPYHTQDPEWCIDSLLEINSLTESIFDKNQRLKDIIKNKRKY